MDKSMQTEQLIRRLALKQMLKGKHVHTYTREEPNEILYLTIMICEEAESTIPPRPLVTDR